MCKLDNKDIVNKRLYRQYCTCNKLKYFHKRGWFMKVGRGSWDLWFPISVTTILTSSVFRPSEKDISVSFTIFVSESAEMCTIFPFSATKIGQFPTSAIFGTPPVVNYNILIAIAKALITANDRTMLAQYGGTIQLGWRWCSSVFKRMNWVNRKSTTSKPLIAPGLIQEVGFSFFKEISEVVQAHNIPPELIINIDQTPLPFVLISKYTMNKKGESNVPILGTADYRQITGTFAITLSGRFLPINLSTRVKLIAAIQPIIFQRNFISLTHPIIGQTNERESTLSTGLNCLMSSKPVQS